MRDVQNYLRNKYKSWENINLIDIVNLMESIWWTILYTVNIIWHLLCLYKWWWWQWKCFGVNLTFYRLVKHVTRYDNYDADDTMLNLTFLRKFNYYNVAWSCLVHHKTSLSHWLNQKMKSKTSLLAKSYAGRGLLSQ